LEIETPYRIAVVCCLGLFAAHRVHFLRSSPRALERPSAAPRREAADDILAVLGAIAVVATLAYVVRPSLMSWASLPLPSAIRWSGAGLSLAGLALLHAAQQTLGDCWSVTARLTEGHRVVRTGPYRRVRHPIYTGLLMILGGASLASANGAVWLSWLATTAFDVTRRMRKEEALLLSHFGAQYADYMEATGRLMPRLRRARR
jgi:protein-S-isoprenylcysteine O-methyltransferase Ste14